MKTAHRNRKSFNQSCNHGFTIIELLLVITIISILSGVIITVMNPTVSRKRSEDAVRRTTMEKLIQAIGSFCAMESTCPTQDTDIVYSEGSTTLSDKTKTYITEWPTGSLGVGAENVFRYYTDGVEYEIDIRLLAPTTTKYLRYNSAWGKIQECTVAHLSYDTTCL